MPQLSPVLGVVIFSFVLLTVVVLMARESEQLAPPKVPMSARPKPRSPLMY
uniref:ATP synthase F0 subunit 8 n=1 Tax=Myosotella myosotis TaxID=252580 RepID=B3DFF3_9EUPU|nr:ATP synthase F0 subunit 8 [Myosotella myosotis]ACE62840.1 ATP synthase F0 subunit 8 [Myosotella myosotis]